MLTGLSVPMQIAIYSVLALVLIVVVIYREIQTRVRPGQMRVLIYHPSTRRMSGHWLKLRNVTDKTAKNGKKTGDRTFSIGQHTYDYVDEFIFPSPGKFRIPMSMYVEGKSKPISFDPKDAGGTDSAEYNSFMEQQVIHELYEAFKPSAMSGEMQMLLIIGAILLGCGAIYWQLGQKIDSVQTNVVAIQQHFVTPTPIATERTGRP